MITLSNGHLEVTITKRGAELQSILVDGAPRLWSGDPEWWSSRAPLLFPIVDKVPNDTLTIGGKPYPMPKHGFARIHDFSVVEANELIATFVLSDNVDTRKAFPFSFRLLMTYALDAGRLICRATVSNEDETAFPFSFGYHPAFLWPIPGHGPREAYEILFEHEEPQPIRRVDGELLSPTAEPSPIDGRELSLRDELFEKGALIFIGQKSRSVTLGPAGRPLIRVDFPEMPDLGIWTKPGAPYVCIEPWQGYASTTDFAGELHDKPGVLILAPGERRTFEMIISAL